MAPRIGAVEPSTGIALRTESSSGLGLPQVEPNWLVALTKSTR